MRRATVVALVLMTCRLAAGEPALAPTHADIAYGADERQVLDVWVAPSAAPTPVVFHVHGGGWVRGDKRPVKDLERYLAAGLSVVSVNYRFVQQAQLAGVEPPVAWPLADIARALQTVRHHASQWRLDPARIAATGGSAGACSSLWLAFHDDLAEPSSSDPVARQSTRLVGVAALIAQTTLDPAQMRAWTPNSRYGGHAFGLWDPTRLDTRDTRFAEFLAARDRLLPWIRRYSPWEHASAGDPPVYLWYSDPPTPGQAAKDPTHTATFGVHLQTHLRSLAVPCELVYPGAPNVRHASAADFLIALLRPTP
jgi:acetyl esterase/lipase